MFALAGITKLLDRQGVRQTIAAFGLPRALVVPVATGLPVAELAVAVGVLVTATAVAAATGALVLLGLFMAGITVNLARGRQPDCRCFGQVHAAPVGWRTLARDGAFAAAAVLVVVEGPGAGLGAWASGLSVIEWAALIVAITIAVAYAVEGSLLVERWRQHGRRR